MEGDIGSFHGKGKDGEKNSWLPYLGVGRVSDSRVMASNFSPDVSEEQRSLCLDMVEKICKRSSKLKPGELKKLAWKLDAKSSEEGCFCVKLDDTQKFVYVVFAMSRNYPEKLAKELINELADKVQSLVTDTDTIAESSIDFNLKPEMTKLTAEYETDKFDKHFLAVERQASRPMVQVTGPPPAMPAPATAVTCCRRVVIYGGILALLGGLTYLILHFTVLKKTASEGELAPANVFFM